MNKIDKKAYHMHFVQLFIFPAKLKIAGIHSYLVFAALHEPKKISCDFEGAPPVVITWRKKAGKEGDSSLLDSERIQQLGNTLYFTGVEEEDEGQYFCKGQNSFSSAESYVNVSVDGKKMLMLLFRYIHLL